ncbi:MAG: TonB family protein [Acidobacteriota bacterium]|nr:TonB family protein [Acidobacteriota bacterium]
MGVPSFIFESQRDPKLMRRAVLVAAIAHVVLFAITFPSSRQETPIEVPAQKAYKIQSVRFEPPQPKTAKPLPKRKVKKVPIPDPTPHLPEPIRTEIYEAPEIEIADIGDFEPNFIPDAPPGPATPSALPIGGEVDPPIKLFAPQPGYTEEARQARVQGVVILQAVINVLGNVTNVKVLKGLPQGLAEAAVDTVGTWQFRPATLKGQPVPVYYNFTVNFSLQ